MRWVLTRLVSGRTLAGGNSVDKSAESSISVCFISAPDLPSVLSDRNWVAQMVLPPLNSLPVWMGESW